MKKLVAIMLMLVMSLSFVLSGCASQEPAPAPAPEAPAQDNEPVAPADPGSAEPAPAESGEYEKVVVKYLCPRGLELYDDADMWVAEYMGYFDQFGIDLVVEMAYGANSPKMLAEGNSDVGAPNPTVITTGIASGMDVIGVYSTCDYNIFGLAVLADSGITDASQLAGKTVAVNSSANVQNVFPFLERVGVDTDTVEIVVAGEQRSMLLSEGSVDACFTWDMEWQMWEAQGLDVTFLSAAPYVPTTANTIICGRDFYENQSDVLVRFLKAYSMGSYFMKLNPEATAEIVSKKFPNIGIDVSVAGPVVQSVIDTRYTENHEQNGLGYQDLDAWREQIEILQSFEVLPADFPDPAEFISNEFIEAANDIDYEKVEADAAAFTLGTVAW